ncbi:MAG: hypothetical protein AAGB46_18650 [Verrucomicrobiota bacterium]
MDRLKTIEGQNHCSPPFLLMGFVNASRLRRGYGGAQPEAACHLLMMGFGVIGLKSNLLPVLGT